MALTVKDRVKESTTTTGTSDFTLGGAASGFQTFAVIGNGNTTYYAAVDQATGDWEVGVGTYSSTGPTLSRDTVLESSNGGSKVSFASGSKDVFCTYPAERSVYLDAAGSAVTVLDIGTLGVGTANITTANITAGTVSTTPVSGNDLANKTYVDTIAASGITYHTPVKYEVPNTTGNLNATYNNGTAGVGATLTNAGTLAAFAPDGPTASPGDRILVYNQTNAYENGVYTVTTVGNGSTAWVLTRATDADTYAIKSPNGLGLGDAFFITSGNTGAGETYVCNTTGTITFGTTAITFVQISDATLYTAGTGLTLSGTEFSITPVGTASTYGSASSVPVFTTNASGQVSSVTNTAIAISSAAVSGLAASATTDTTNATNITSGTLPTGRLSGSYTGITGVGTLAAGTWNGSTIGAGYGGTGQSSYTIGDILYADGSTSLAKLADVATGNALISGGVGTAPAWGKIGLQTHVSGTLQVSNGGTGATTLTGYVYGNGTGAMTASTTIPNSATTATSANTASAIVARDASGNFSAGTITASLNGNASTATTAANVNNGTLTMNVSGTGLSGSQTFTANQSGNATFTVTSNATSANTASTIVARDASGNFSAGTITATLSGNASSATNATYATSAGSATNATYATSAGSASSATNATYATSAGSATNATTATNLSGGTVNGINIQQGNVAQNVKITTAGGTDSGVSLYNSSGTWLSQWYATSGSYGFLNGNWAGWDIQKSVNGQLLLTVSGTQYTTLHTGNYSSYALPLSGGTLSGALTGTTANFTSYVTTSGPYYRNAAGAGYLNGQYGSVEGVSTSGAIYSIGGSYVPGTTTLGNMYGIGYTYTGPGRALGNPAGAPSDLWGMYVASSGGATVFLDASNGRGYFAGNLYVNNGTQVVYNSGTWSINVTGSAGSATNASYATNAGYATSAGSATNATYATSAGSVTTASQVTINYNNDSNSTYQMLWGSGNSVYGTAGIYCNPFTDILYAAQLQATSDESLKTNWRPLPDTFVEDLTTVQHGIFEWLRNGQDDVGVSAQSLQKILSVAVKPGADGKLTVNYGNAALVAAIKLAERVVAQDVRIAKLEEAVAKLMEGQNK